MKTKTLFLLIALCAISCAQKASSHGTQENVDVTKIYNIIILDQSGSMEPLREVAVQGYNQTLEIVRKAQIEHDLVQQNLVSLVLFNDQIETIIDCQQVQSVNSVLMQQYLPDGRTALFDAMGVTLSSLKTKLDSLENATAVITIISDGWENSSRIYNVVAVSQLVDQLKEMGVMFVFLGTNQDVSLMSSLLHIDNYRLFEYSPQGLDSAWKSNIDASARYYNRMQQYNQNTKGMSRSDRNNYYQQKTKEDGWFQK